MSTDERVLSYDEAIRQLDNALPALLATVTRLDGVYSQADMTAIGAQFYDWQVEHPDVDEAIAEHVESIGDDDAYVAEGAIETFIAHHSKVWWIEFLKPDEALDDLDEEEYLERVSRDDGHEPYVRITRGLPSQHMQ